jgi:hypothetical protein
LPASLYLPLDFDLVLLCHIFLPFEQVGYCFLPLSSKPQYSLLFMSKINKTLRYFRPVKKPPKSMQERAEQAALEEVHYLNGDTQKLLNQVMDDLKLNEKQKEKVATFTSGQKMLCGYFIFYLDSLIMFWFIISFYFNV